MRTHLAATTGAGQQFCYGSIMQTDSQANDGTAVALMLSGGGVLGNYHLGVARSLHQAGLLPRIISGASAGALVAAMLCSQKAEDLDAMLTANISAMDWLNPHKADFYASMVAADAMQAFVEQVIPDLTFAESYQLSGKHLAISVAAPKLEDSGLLLSHISTPDILIRDAVMASCAVPVIFAPKPMRTRRNGETERFRGNSRWIDGSIYADLPKTELQAQFGVSKFLSSMVNPAALPYGSGAEIPFGNVRSNNSAGALSPMSAMPVIASLVQGLTAMMGIGVATSRTVTQALPAMASVFEQPIDMGDYWGRMAAQSYEADVTIRPRQSFYDAASMISFLCDDQRKFMILEGEASARDMIEEISHLSNN
jgi:TAG lipase/steryl ester hydrolase/phospholipase A2/LPA acyltransferase